MTSLHQIYYDEKQLSKLYPFAIPYKNEGLTIYFENTPIVAIVQNTTADRVGVCSWKLQDKLRMRVGLRGALTQEALNPYYDVALTQEGLNSDYDVLSFTRNSHKHQMLAMANQWHPHFLTTIKLLWEKLGYKMPSEAKNPIYQNHYSAKTEIYKRYVSEFLTPAIELTEKDEELHHAMTQPSGYEHLNRQADIKSVKAKLNLNSYPLAPFILERCPSLWLTMHKINVSYL